MEKKRTALYVAGYLLFVLAVCLAFSFAPVPKIVVIDRQAGVVDLSAADFTDTVYYYLDNHWENYPERFYTPADFSGDNPPAPQPMSYDDFRRVQYATHRMEMKLPPGEVYGLYMKSADYAMRIFIDENEAGCVGLPTDNPETNIPRVAEGTYYFIPEKEVTTILVQSSNWVHKEGAYHPNLYVGTSGNIERMNRRNLLFTAVLVGCLLTAFLYYLGIFVLNRTRLPTLLFSLCCLLLALLVGNLIPVLVPDYNWFVVIRLQYMVRCLIFAGLVLFLETLFPPLLHPRVTRPYYAITAAYLLLILAAPPTLSSRTLIGFDGASAVMVAYVLARLGMQLRARKLQNTLAFLGTALVCLFGVNDMLQHNNIYILGHIGGQLFSAPIGMTFFVFCYGLVLSLEYAETEQIMLAARESEQRLAAENAALDRLHLLKSDMLATISHETRTPLAVLSGYADVIAMEMRKKGVNEQTAHDLSRISGEAQRLADIMAEMQRLSGARDAAAHKAPTDLSQIIHSAARLYTPILARQRTTLETVVQDNLPPVYANANELTQVLFNLLANAKNHTGDGDSVAVHAKFVTQNAELMEPGMVVVTARDTGAGVPPELLPHIFERGVTGGPEGSGMGLAICKEIVEGHGGRIFIESEPGKGTTAIFQLPIYVEGKEEAGHERNHLIG